MVPFWSQKVLRIMAFLFDLAFYGLAGLLIYNYFF